MATINFAIYFQLQNGCSFSNKSVIQKLKSLSIIKWDHLLHHQVENGKRSVRVSKIVQGLRRIFKILRGLFYSIWKHFLNINTRKRTIKWTLVSSRFSNWKVNIFGITHYNVYGSAYIPPNYILVGSHMKPTLRKKIISYPSRTNS